MARPGLEPGTPRFSGTPELAAKVFAKLCELQRTASGGGAPPLIWMCLDQLRSAFRAIPVEIAVAGMMPSLAGAFDADSFDTVVDVFGRVNADAGELRSEISEPLRQSLRRYLKDGITKLLAEDLFQ